MFKKIKIFLFGKPAAESAIQPAPEKDAPWVEAKEVVDTLKAVAVQKEAAAVVEVAPAPVVEITAPPSTKKKRTFVKREPKAEPVAQWPFPIEKPSEGVTTAEFEALKIEPAEVEAATSPAAMKVQRKRKEKAAPKQA